MSDYNIYPAVDSQFRFPSVVREALAAATEFVGKFAHLDENDKLVIGGTPVGEPSPVAGINQTGWARAVFVPNGETIPGDTPPYTIVIEEA